MWQFRLWINAEEKYFEKPLRAKSKTDVIDLAEEMYVDLRNELHNGKKLFSPTITDAVQLYLAYREQDVRTEYITEGRWNTISSHLNHFLNYVRKDEKVANFNVNTLVKYERNDKETNCVLFRNEQNTDLQTIRNEMAIMNACQRYLYEVEQLT